MRFWEAVAACLGGFATFTGRSGRREFWWFAGFVFFASALLAALAAEVPAFAPIAHIAIVTLAVPLAAVTVRRLHDIGRPGGLALLVLVPVAGVLVLGQMLARRGEPGDNRFGDDPRYTVFEVAG
ncbi:DUF805 domain-containing protein [Limibaculum sp. FT325]|uniref:DUF805 domain-containing protein n=1 Tax=Thermohalobaculum sediminis TaxID=2939436 RepID=UPI0020BF9049|nr:DUF805 domain-containing protein [Limibaculum sediminis]MCL5776752.1 DUF805 domain-containing protein [Limibaculum sediminis]